MEKNENKTMEKNDKAITTDEPEVNYRGVKAMLFIIGNETFEKLGAIGTLANLLVYLTTVFNMKSITATTIVNVFNGTTNFATLLGAYLCDKYFGLYKTLGFASVASFLGKGGDSRGNWSAEDLNKGRLDYLAYFLMCLKWCTGTKEPMPTPLVFP